ncbi:MAG: MATE family efflux transporter, partial [Paraclostridium sp.]
YGAGKLDRVRKTFKLLILSCLTYTVVMWGAIMVFPQVYVSIFNSNPQLVEITVWSMRIYFAGIFIFGAQIACQQTFLALGQAKISMILALLRKIILLIPLIFILPMVVENKLQGVLMAEPIADIVAAVTTIIFFTAFYKKTLSVEHPGQLNPEMSQTKE